MIRNFFTLFLLLTFFTVSAQDLIERTQLGIPPLENTGSSSVNGVAKTLHQKKQVAASRSSRNYQLFKIENNIKPLPANITKGVLLNLQKEVLADIRRQAGTLLNLSIPVNESASFELDLYQVDIHAPGFEVTTSSPVDQVVNHTGIFYHGIIKGDPNSAVAVSIFDDLVDIFIQDQVGNYKVATSTNKEDYTLYNGHNRFLKNKVACGTKGSPSREITREETVSHSRSNIAAEVPIYLEVDYALYTEKNRNLNTVNRFIEILVAETTALYARLEIPIKISRLKIHTTPDGYPAGVGDPKLTAFAETIKGDYPGILAHLISGEEGGGIAALGVLCATFEKDGVDGGPYGLSGIGEPDAQTPDLDDINTFAHELGHNFGSHHTQACFWNGNNTAIDGCVSPEGLGDEEPSCSRPNTDCPAGGGTIMSYCSTPDDPLEDCIANNNWHPQVAAYIKSQYAEAIAEGCIANAGDTADTGDTDTDDNTDNTGTGGDTGDTDDTANTGDTPLEMEIQSQMQTHNLPSMSIGVLSCKELSWSKGFGQYDIANKKQATDETIYTLASLTKVVTATAVFHLMETGAFKLDDDINQYLPYNIVNPDYPNTPITFRMLLQHKSSIIDNDLIYTGYTNGDHPESLSDFIFKYLNPNGANYEVSENFDIDQPGTYEEYSNTGITLLGYLVEVISKMPFNQYCNTNLFMPMDMNNTRFFLSELNVSNVAIPYSWNNSSRTYETEGQYGFPDYPNGLLRSTVKDLSNFFSMYLNNGIYKGKQILTPQSINQLTPSNYGQGHTWFKSDDIMPNGERSWGHSGYERGTATLGVFENNRNGAVIILTNGDELEDLNELTFWDDLWKMTANCSTPTVVDVDQDGFNSSVDCNDNNPQINPGQTEIAYNGMDDDCNPATRDDDLDQDGFNSSQDCDDNNAQVNPGQREITYNGIDDDCNPATRDDDLDQDGFNRSQDCDDNNAQINPSQTEIAYNGMDDDCNAATLDDDLDRDGFGRADDCNDLDVFIYPGAAEIADNGIDEDCDGQDATTVVDDEEEDMDEQIEEEEEDMDEQIEEEEDTPITSGCATIPSNLTTSSISDNNAYIYTTQPKGAINNQFRYRPRGSGTWKFTSISTSYYRYLSGLLSGTEYEFQVSQACEDGSYADFTASSYFTTTGVAQGGIGDGNDDDGNNGGDGNTGEGEGNNEGEDSPTTGNCASITGNLTTSSVSDNNAYVYTPQPNGAINNQFRYRPTNGGTWKFTSISTNYYRYLSGLLAGTEYEFQVSQACEDGTYADFSASSYFTTTGVAQGGGNDNTTEEESENSDCRSISADQLYVTSLGASAAYVYTPQPYGVTNNQFRYRQIGTTNWIETDISTLYYRYLNGLTRGTAYEYQVRQECSAGVWSSYSDSYGFTTVTSFQSSGSLEPMTYAAFRTISTSKKIGATQITPNPVLGALRLQVDQPFAAHASLRIYSITGTLVEELPAPIGTTQTTINVHHLQSGIYLLEYRTATSRSIEKFVKR